MDDVLVTENARSASASRYDGADAAGTVWTGVDDRGRLVNLEISRRWRARLASGDLAAAVYDSYVTAMHRYVEAEVLPELVCVPHETVARGRSGRARDAGWRVARGRAVRVADAPDPGDVTEFRGSSGYLTLRVRSGAAVGVTGDPTVLAKANPEQVRTEALEIFRLAGLTADRRG
jgi:hypothetical protein